MSCCSDRRATAAPLPALRAAALKPAPRATQQGGTLLHFTGSANLALRGPFSGKVYRIAPSHRMIAAHPDDVAALLRTGLFVKG